MTRRRSSALCLLAALLSLAAGAEPRLLDSRRLFSIRSNYNRNEVVYDALLEGGGFDLQRPVRGYWILHMRGDRLEEFGGLEEHLAFGLVLEKVTREEVVFHLKGAPHRPIVVRLEGAQVTASTDIRGEESTLAAIFASVDKRGLIPSVNYVELLGHSRASGKLVSERVVR